MRLSFDPELSTLTLLGCVSGLISDRPAEAKPRSEDCKFRLRHFAHEGRAFIGVAAEPALQGQTAKICTRLMMTSDDPLFHTIAENLSAAIEHAAATDRKKVDLRRASTALLVVKPNGAADLWVDSAAMTLTIMAKRSVKAGSAIFEDHIGDIVGMDFPAAGVTTASGIICVFRVGWRFGLFFDLDRARPLDLSAMRRDLGRCFVYCAIETYTMLSRTLRFLID